MSLVRSLCAVTCLLLPGGSALAQGDPEAGRQIARQWCSACHVVDRNGTGTDAAPALPSLLADKTRTADQIEAWLFDPHPPMEGLDLTQREVADVIAYLESLAVE